MARDKRMEVRVDAEERAQILANAEEAGFDSYGDFMRTLALQSSNGGAKQEPADGECPHIEIEDLSNGTTIVNVGRCKGCGAIVKIDPDRGSVYSEGADVERERIDIDIAIAEAKLEEAAHEAFIARRTRELHAAGRTTPVARREAEAEWRAR